MNTGRVRRGKYKVISQEGEPSPHADRWTGRVTSLESAAATEGPAGEGGDDRCSGLDRRVVELLESAGEVLAGQGGLWNLLRPGRDGTADMDLAEVLPVMVEAARELSEAGCAGLGWAVRGEPFRFLEDPPGVGTPRMGAPPEVVSLGARSVAEGWPVRRRHRLGIPVPAGVLKDRDQGRSLLCVPLPPRGEVSGYLYVADKGGGADLTADDEELLVALASAVAAGVDGPIRPDEAAIPPGISTQVPALAEAGAVVRALAQTVMQLVDGDAAVVVQPIRAGSLRVVAAAGQRWTPLADQVLSIDETLSGLAIIAVAPWRCPTPEPSVP